MIKLGQTAIIPAGIEKVYIGTEQVFGLPAIYRKIAGIVFNANTYYEISNFNLKGSDTVRLSLSIEQACNVFGSYVSSSSTKNYSLYCSTTSGAQYMRYNGGTYNSYFPSASLNTRYDIIISPSGSSGLPVNDTWSEVDFVTETNMYIGITSVTATSRKLDGKIWGSFIVDGRFKGIPCERISDGIIGYYDVFTDRFFEPIGSNPIELIV